VKVAAATLMFFCLPTLARAEGTNSQGFSFFSSFLQMVAALTIVVGLILLTRHFSNKIMGGSTTARFTSKHIRLVETRYIAPKKAILLIEVGGTYLLLASSEDNLTFIKQVDILEDIEILEGVGTVRGGLAGLFRRDKAGQKG
jgi:flagellar protein FliO/FliZ